MENNAKVTMTMCTCGRWHFIFENNDEILITPEQLTELGKLLAGYDWEIEEVIK